MKEKIHLILSFKLFFIFIYYKKKNHSFKHFFNLIIEKKNHLSLFHKLIIFDLTDMFIITVDKFVDKINIKTSLQKEVLKNNINSNNTKILISLEEKPSYDTEDNNKTTLVNLLSLIDKEGNIPMLFASYQGNIKIIDDLIELGAKYDYVNNSGLNIVHIAAQSRSFNVIIYFK